jgi:hypothetical protein
MNEILNVNERWYPTPSGMERKPVTVVLVAGSIGDYAAYVGIGTKEDAVGISRHGDKLSFSEACCHFPFGLERDKYRD